MSRVHSFKESLAYSHAQEDAPWWFDVYSEAFKFPGLLAVVSCRGDGEHQRAGVDRVLTLANAQVVFIDEKVRKKTWPDFCLEAYSDLDRKTPGWIRKPLRAHYIAYAFAPTGECYLLPVPTLQRAWRLNIREWWAQAKERRNGFGIVDAINDGWMTRSVSVPRSIVLSAVADAMLVRFTPAEEEGGNP